jgi:3-oxoacyl-[acyl-carrier-protein] synthase-3
MNPKQTQLRDVGILGTGAYVPDRVLSNADLEKLVDTSDEWIFTRTGMRERRIAAADQATSDLCIAAGRRALEDAKVAPGDVDLVIVATVTPDHLVPSTSCLVQRALGLVNAAAFDLNAACSGFVTALFNARWLVATGAFDRVLVIGAECMSRIVNYEDRTSCILFGDAAGAAVVAPFAGQGKILDGDLGADGTGAETMVVQAVGSRQPATVEGVQNKDHLLRMRGNEVFKFAVQKFRDLVREQLERTGFQPSDLALVIPHQVNFRIIESALKKLDINDDRIYINLDRYGNTSAGSVPLALDEARRLGRFKTGDLVSLVAFGAGLTWASALIRW